MLLDSKTAVVDNDFISHIIETHIMDDALISALRAVFSKLDLTAVVHPLVHKNEVQQDKRRFLLLIQENILHIADFSDIFLGDSERKAYYLFLVQELYRHLKGSPLPVDDEAILTYWVRQQSLGEIHSISMCLVCGSGIFLSDDGDSKILERYVKQMAIGAIVIYKRKELIEEYQKIGGTELPRHIRQSLAHAPLKR